MELDLLKATVSTQIDLFKGNAYDISKMETKLEQDRNTAIVVASKAMPDKFGKIL